jgi:hypothetical protein
MAELGAGWRRIRDSVLVSTGPLLRTIDITPLRNLPEWQAFVGGIEPGARRVMPDLPYVRL